MSFQCRYAVIRFQRGVNLAPILMQSYQLKKPCLLGFINVQSRAILLPFGWKISIELLRYLCARPAYKSDIDKYWNTIKIAKRNGYEFKDVRMWFDYIKMLERMGRDLNSPSLIAPQDLKTAHDEYVEKVNRQRVKEQKEANRKKAEADQAKFEELKGRYIGLSMTDGTIRLHTLDSVAEYYDEGGGA